jgi:hypothetical protein
VFEVSNRVILRRKKREGERERERERKRKNNKKAITAREFFFSLLQSL